MTIRLENIRVAQTLGEEGYGTAFLLDTPRNRPQNVLALPLHTIDVKVYHNFLTHNMPPVLDVIDAKGNHAQAQLCYLPPRTTHKRQKGHVYHNQLYSRDGDVAFAQIIEHEHGFQLTRLPLAEVPSSPVRAGMTGYPDARLACGWGIYKPSSGSDGIFEGARALCQCGGSGSPILSEYGHVLGMAIVRHFKLPRLDLFSSTALKQHLQTAYTRMTPSPRGLPREITHIPPSKGLPQSFRMLSWEDPQTTI